MPRFVCLALFVSGFMGLVGCGGGESKVADKPSQEAIEAYEKSNKAVEEEERGTPVKKKR